MRELMRTQSTDKLERLFRARVVQSLITLVVISAGSWLLFSTAQAVGQLPPIDHRHIDSWQIVTGILLLGWIAALILDHNLLREEKRGAKGR